MILMKFPLILPRRFEGKWRLIQIGEFKVNGQKKVECTKINFDLIDI